MSAVGTLTARLDIASAVLAPCEPVNRDLGAKWRPLNLKGLTGGDLLRVTGSNSGRVRLGLRWWPVLWFNCWIMHFLLRSWFSQSGLKKSHREIPCWFSGNSSFASKPDIPNSKPLVWFYGTVCIHPACNTEGMCQQPACCNDGQRVRWTPHDESSSLDKAGSFRFLDVSFRYISEYSSWFFLGWT